jgi:hypothetical protein
MNRASDGALEVVTHIIPAKVVTRIVRWIEAELLAAQLAHICCSRPSISKRR